MYPLIFRTLFVPMDAERAHKLSFDGLRLVHRLPVVSDVCSRVWHRGTADPAEVLGLPFPNRLGLAAGFDKDARGVAPMSMLGFGHVEVGTITAEGQPGNPAPRSFRLVKSRGLLNRMGFNNKGAEAVRENLLAAREQVDSIPASRRPVIGVNIGKTKKTPAAEAVEDYRRSAEVLSPLADYLVINVSSPNTPGLRDLQSVEALRPIVRAVKQAAAEAVPAPRSTLGHVPLLVKIAPDLADEDVLEVCTMAREEGLDGLVVTNTLLDRTVLEGEDRTKAEAEAGGISGLPLAERSFEVLRLVKQAVGDDLVVVSVGGVDTPADAAARLGAGADLVQVFSGMIYGGPFWPGRLLRKMRGTRH